MKTFRMAALSVLALCLITSCKPAREKSSIVEFTCAKPISLLDYANGEASCIDSNGPMAVYSHGPSLYMIFPAEKDKDTDREFIYLYLPEDGNRVELRMDGDLLYANGVVRSICQPKNRIGNYKEWFAAASPDDFKTVRIVVTEDDSMNDDIETMLKSNPSICVAADDKYPETIEPATPLFMALGGTPTNDLLSKIDLSKVKVLMLADASPEYIDALCSKSMPQLDRLILDSDSGTEKLFKTFPHVKSVGFLDCKTLPSLAGLQNLEELHIVADDETAVDLSELPHPSRLRVLSIPSYHNAKGIDQLSKLEYLNPGEQEFTDETLAELVAAHPDLRFLDLLTATVQSLTPLKQARHLEGIELSKSMEDAPPDFAPLGGLKHLRYVGLTEKLKEKPEVVDALKKECPQCVIFCHDTFCLGSGWLALFLPLLIAILVYKKRKQARIRP